MSKKSGQLDWMRVYLSSAALSFSEASSYFHFENIQPMIFRLYFLIPLEKGLIELLNLELCTFCATNCSIGLGTEGSEFLFQERFRGPFFWELLVTVF